MNFLEYTNIQEYPVAIEFFESGGPVASRYKYITHVKVFSKSGKIFLNYKEVREFLSNKPRLVVSNEKELSFEVYKEFLADLFNHGITQRNQNFITEASSTETPSYFLFTLGNEVKVRFDYLLSHKDTPEFQPFEDIIQSIKNLLFSNFG